MIMLILIPMFNEGIYVSKHKLDVADVIEYHLTRFLKYPDQKDKYLENLKS